MLNVPTAATLNESTLTGRGDACAVSDRLSFSFHDPTVRRAERRF
jgi:hypothetical protein